MVHSIAVIPIRIALREPVFMSGQQFSVADNVLVRCAGVDGLVGWGEATSALATTGEDPVAIREELEGFVRTAFARGVDTVELRGRAVWILSGRPAARSALDMALTDLEARTAEAPAWSWLGGPSDGPQLLASTLISGGTPEAEIAQAIERVTAGYRWLKLKIGRRTVEVEAATAVEIRRQVGPTVGLGVDANEGLSLEGAIRFVDLARGAELAFIEQPLDRHDLRGLEGLRGRIDIDVLVDEGAGDVSDIERHHQQGAADGAVLKFQKAGGVTELVEAARAAHRAGMRVGFTGKVAESSIAGAALLHVARAAGPADYGVSLTASSLDHDLVHTPITAADGVLLAPPGAGFGVEVDERLVDGCRVA